MFKINIYLFVFLDIYLTLFLLCNSLNGRNRSISTDVNVVSDYYKNLLKFVICFTTFESFKLERTNLVMAKSLHYLLLLTNSCIGGIVLWLCSTKTWEFSLVELSISIPNFCGSSRAWTLKSQFHITRINTCQCHISTY